MIYITGDTHGGGDVKKLLSRQLMDKLTKDDILIVAGDFGFIWEVKKESGKEKNWLEWFEKMDWTTLFIDGNHENFTRLYAYPEKDWNGGKVHVIRDHLYHLERGNIYTLEGKKLYVMGGASSHDKLHTPSMKNKGWWEEELPSKEEYELSEFNLNKCERNVDCIITHCLPTSVQHSLKKEDYKKDHLTDYLEEIMHNTEYHYWYAGHYHEDSDIDDKMSIVFRRVVPLFSKVSEVEPVVGNPIYNKEVKVCFMDKENRVEGIIKNIYPWGMPPHKNEPVYDIQLEDGIMMNKVAERAIIHRVR